MREEDLERAILEANNALTKDELERMVQAKLKTSPFLTRLGALLIILEEQRLAAEFLKQRDYGFTKISSLTTGIQSVSVVGRTLGSRIVVGVDGKPSLRLRLWDGTAAIDVIVWENFDRLTPLQLGDVVAVRNGYVSSSRPGQEILLQAGSKSRVEKMSKYEGLPPVDKALFKLPNESRDKAGKRDVYAVVVLNTGVKKTSNGTDVCELVVTDGDRESLLIAWREWANYFSSVAEGQSFFAASVEVKNGELFTAKSTIITLAGKDDDLLSKAWQRGQTGLRVKVLGFGFDGLPAVTDGVKVMKMASPAVADAGECTVVEKAFVIYRRGIPYVYGTKSTPAVCSIETPELKRSIEEVQGRLAEGVIECVIARKTPVSVVNTKYGQKKLTGFWVSFGGKTISCTAWGKASELIENLAEGANVRFAFPKVGKNKFGDIELSVDELSFIEVCEKQVK
ncbi:MAG: hypothetical protein QXR26_00690 [Candidatus Caldarchaeum sp.]